MEFVSKDLAIKLKEKGFDKPCFGFYNPIQDELQLYCVNNKDVTYKNILTSVYKNKVLVDAPTIEQILKWLREDKDIHIKSDICFRYTSEHKKDKNGTYSGYMDVSKPFWSFLIRRIKNGNCVYDNTTASNNEYFSYEDACIAGIEYVIEHLI